MDRIDARLAGYLEQPILVEVALRRQRRPEQKRLIRHLDVHRPRICLGVHRHRGNTHRPQRPRDPHRDLAAISNENFPKELIRFGHEFPWDVSSSPALSPAHGE
jgi:hypothetical protein